MSTITGIQWCDATWNPWQGCIKVSPGCKYCYMYNDKRRYGQDPRVVVRSKTTFTVPLTWEESRRVFTCSWSDFFIEEADEWRDEAWDVIRQTPQHTYQILTKRPERIAEHLPADWGQGWPHVWLGVSVEQQQYLEERVPTLQAIPAYMRFLSCEPLLNTLTFLPGLVESHGLSWVIIGGESGPGARPTKLWWILDLIEQCDAAGIAVFVKQVGSVLAKAMGLKDKKGGDVTEWPDEIQVRQFPQARGPLALFGEE